MREPQVDWPAIEDRLLRQAAKVEAFRELYDQWAARSADDDRPTSPTGRMVVQPPAYHPVRASELGK
jgi:alkylation response protein AidB-like acyl-CoA dehydrogenase